MSLSDRLSASRWPPASGAAEARTDQGPVSATLLLHSSVGKHSRGFPGAGLSGSGLFPGEQPPTGGQQRLCTVCDEFRQTEDQCSEFMSNGPGKHM